MTQTMSNLEIPTNWGNITVSIADGQVVACSLPEVAEHPAQPLKIGRSVQHITRSQDRSVVKAADEFVRALLLGRKSKRPPIRLPDGTDFQRKVWRKLSALSFGECLTYGQLAAAIGHPRSARALGGACGANPMPLFIPCHRIVAGDGGLGGFSSGLGWKKHLLEREKSHPLERSATSCV